MKIKGMIKKGGMYNQFVFQSEGNVVIDLFPNKHIIGRFIEELNRGAAINKRFNEVEIELKGITTDVANKKIVNVPKPVDLSTSVDKPKRKRGRPRKIKPMVVEDTHVGV